MTLVGPVGRAPRARRRRRLRAAVVLAGCALALSLTACTSDAPADEATATGTASAPASTAPGPDEVAAALEPQLSDVGIVADPGSLDCGDQASLTDASSVECGFTAGGQPVTLTADVTPGADGEATLAVETKPEPVPADVLAADLTARTSAAMGVTLDPGSCAGDLPAEVGASTTCTVRSGSQSREADVSVTAINGGEIVWGAVWK